MRPKSARVSKRKPKPRRTTPLKRPKIKPRKKLAKVLHTAEEIPNEILSQILCRCDEPTLRVAMRTCRRWHSVINETIGVSVAIGKPRISFQRRPTIPFKPIEVIERIGVKHCYVGDLRDVQGCPFAYPQTVRNIEFDGPITNFNLVTLLAPLSALTHLSMHYSALENAELTQDTLNSSTLKSLRITSNGVGDEYDRNKSVAILKNIISLLKFINSTKLAILILDIINIPYYERRVTEAVFTVLLRHKYTMKNVQFYNISERLDPSPPGTENESPETEFVKEDIIAKTIQEAVYLKRISYGGKRHMQSEEAWNLLIQSQKSLQELFYMNDNRDIDTTCIPCLSKNFATLEKTLFHINGVDESRNVVKFDCRIFKSFQKLTHLLIRGRKVIFPFADGIQQHQDGNIAIARITVKMPVLKNLEYVPNTVTVFSMRDICIETESLSKFNDSGFLPNLIKFRLAECGSLGGFGLSPETLIELLRRQSLQEIEIIKSFSLSIWDNASGKDIYEDALLFRIKTLWEFHAKKDSSGIFCTKDEPMFNYGRFETTLRADDVCEVVFQ